MGLLKFGPVPLLNSSYVSDLWRLSTNDIRKHWLNTKSMRFFFVR